MICKSLRWFLLATGIFPLLGLHAQIELGDFEFVSPKQDSKYHSVETRIALRPGPDFQLASLADVSGLISLEGEISGTHDFDLSLSGDKLTLNIVPRVPFEEDEIVTVWVGGLFLIDGIWNEAFSWQFETSKKIKSLPLAMDEVTGGDREFPEITFLVEPQSGLYDANIFSNVKSPGEAYMSILGPDGQVLWEIESPGFGTDFKLNRNGLPTYFGVFQQNWKMLDTNGEIIRSFIMLNGYTPDEHDFQILPNGNYLLFAYDDQLVDMSQVVDGGNPNALVEGFVVQEIDYDNNLIMQWRSWDYLEITDNEEQNLLSDNINAFHINAVEVDVDGHIIISCRHTNEITKYDRNTGVIIWRLSINASGQFDFIGDEGFSFQHDCRGLGDDRYLLFDNANLTGQESRVVEYQLDLENGTATKVWEYIHPEGIFSSSRGGCKRLPNGNTIIMWGAVSLDEYGGRTTEVTADGDILLDFVFPLVYNGYRSPKHSFLFGNNYVGGCGDEMAVNFNPQADYWLPEFCGYDLDNDGWADIDGDCNDMDDTIYPGAEEIANDGIDQDCDGEDLTDVDGDGFSVEDGDCDDEDDSIYPGAEEVPYDGIDQDCDGEDLIDVDGDGFSPEDGDCDDENPDVNPDAEEIANDGIDQDCDGEDLVVGLDEILSFIHVGPNPTSGILNIKTPLPCTVYIVDAQGKLALMKELESSSTVDLTGYAQGYYLVTIDFGTAKLVERIMLSPAE